MVFKLKASLLFIAFSLLVSCGYTVGERGVKINDETYEKVAVPAFHNKTTEGGIEAYITKALRQNIIEEGAFELTINKNAHLIIEGNVVGAGTEVLAIDRAGSATEYRLTMAIAYTVIDNVTGKNLFSDTISSRWDYKYQANSIDNRIARNDALENLSKEIARDILMLLKARYR
ncbi:MAG: hypothetical protein HQK84_02980 [Nitrospinae bacterium]|nr:hypothetical protein [Nitrospinota bacterium]